MSALLFFQIIQPLVAVLFFLLAFGSRFRPGSMSVVRSLPVLIVSIFLLFIVGYIWTLLVSVSDMGVLDLFAFLIMIAGTLLALKARLDLRQWYSGPGFFTPTPQLIRTGTYRYVRHPLYVGMFLFVVGSLYTFIVHAHLIVAVAAVLLGAALLAFITLAARREEIHLQEAFGEVYHIYRSEVHAFFPVGMRRGRREESDR